MNVVLVKHGNILHVEVGGMRMEGHPEVTIVSDIVQIPDCDNPNVQPQQEVVAQWLTIRLPLNGVEVRQSVAG